MFWAIFWGKNIFEAKKLIFETLFKKFVHNNIYHFLGFATIIFVTSAEFPIRLHSFHPTILKTNEIIFSVRTIITALTRPQKYRMTQTTCNCWLKWTVGIRLTIKVKKIIAGDHLKASPEWSNTFSDKADWFFLSMD